MDNYKKYTQKMKRLSDPKTFGLIPLEDFKIGDRVFWFYPQTQNKQVIIASDPIGEDRPRVRIDHINRDGSTREGGYVNTDELYKKSFFDISDDFTVLTSDEVNTKDFVFILASNGKLWPLKVVDDDYYRSVGDEDNELPLTHAKEYAESGELFKK
ncbi:MAG: hypothetical protein SLAVMIC_00036 [uncultured marine phage]|uniref:Uncharacterized protein n=1 Tax=uncultured marine phage TaxID=707152 RepID=A0A8D9CDE5_9VIRU|nr:MAG: hypothetical protein SLAVMIC_00036 [uncultured marine phage]